MIRKMQAAQVEEFGQPLVFNELDVPTPGPGQILVQTEACGVCHTDLHARNGDWPLKPPLPFTPGHEGIGIVSALGAGVTAVKEGDRVGVPWLYSACGHCEFCLAAQEPVCAEAQFGEYIIADPNYVAHIPARLCCYRCRALDLRRHHLVQGSQGNAGQAWSVGRNLGHRGAGASGCAIRQGHGSPRLCRGHRRCQAGTRHHAWVPMRSSMPSRATQCPQ